MSIPDWQLPAGVDRGLWDYLHSGEMVAGYDAQMAASPLAAADVRFCETWFPTPGRLLDLGCGTGRLCRHFAATGYECVGVDLSDEMLAAARVNAPTATFRNANLVEPLPGGGFDYAACLFSTLGMVRGAENRGQVLANAFRALKPGGRFVLHVHNRHFRRLGAGRVVGQAVRTLLGRPSAGDVTMPQAYAGAPLTLHHFTKRGAARALAAAEFRVLAAVPLGLDAGGGLGRPWFLPSVRAYGWLFAAERPAEAGQLRKV